MSKQEELARVIYDMRRSIPELHGVMVASVDGLSIAHDFPEAEAYYECAITLPLYPAMTEEAQDAVVTALRDALT